MTKTIFNEDFTSLYPLSKTLRFELVPIGKTREKINENLQYDEKLQTFLSDQQIEDAYQILKPVFDKIHEEFITKSLESNKAKEINFSKYLELKKELLKIDKKQKETDYRNKQKEIEDEEKRLRREIVKLYEVIGNEFANESGKNDKGKPILKEKGFKVLTESGILKYIKANIDKFVELKLKTREEIIGKKENKNLVEREDLVKALVKTDTENKGIFDGFFTYFSGFNQNRENYYSEEDKSTSVANRIVNENLPKFVDNIFLFEKQRKEYVNAFQYLQGKNIILKNKDGEDLYTIKEEFFEIIYFTKCLSQVEIEDYNKKIGNANFLINLYNQQRKKEIEVENEKIKKENRGLDKDSRKAEIKFEKLSQFKILYKQIGCGEKKEFITLIKNDNELMKTLLEIRNAGQKYFVGESKIDEEKNKIDDFANLLKNHNDYKGIYWNKQAINTISGKYFANWHDLQDKLKDEKVFQKADKNSDEKIKIPDAVELSDLFAVLDYNIESNWRDKGIFFKTSLFEGDDKDRNIKMINELLEKGNYLHDDKNRNIKMINEARKPSEALLNIILADLQASVIDFIENKEVVENGIVKIIDFKADIEKAKIKLWLDKTLVINRILKYFMTKENKRKGSLQDSQVENILGKLIFEFDWFKNYDAVRNYLTKKPQSDINKLKLNFENATLAGGWDVNKETANLCIILQDEKQVQYLVILRNEDKKIFEKELIQGKGKNKMVNKNPLFDESGKWQKMEYKQIAAPTGIGGFVRKCFVSAQQYGWKCPSNCLNSENKIIIKNDEANGKLKELIDCYKDFFDKYEKNGFKYKDYNFQFKESSKYETLNEFFVDVENQGYKISFINISKDELDKLIEAGKLYLFQIKNQDYNANKKEGHKNNLHTIYWQAIFGNTENKPKLNGEAEIFYRPSLKNPEKITNKKGNEIIKNYRYSKEKFIFHCPTTLNSCSKNTKVNDLINTKLSKPENVGDIHFLGIDRGEKHLAYYSLVNQKGEILKQGTLNLAFEKPIKAEKWFEDKTKSENDKNRWYKKIVDCYNYNDLLDARASNRDMARKNWQTIGTIKELKDGYISQVIREIVDLAIENNAFIVLENLNSGFKNSRKKIEKQVYQKLELALAKKLNFVVNKSAKDEELLSVQKALQLTPPVNNFGDIENARQYGIMLYTRANYTSQTDPKTGWRKTIYLKKGSEEDIKTQICKAFDDFGFDGKDYYFDYIDNNTSKLWRLYSGKDGKSLDRYRGKLNNDKNIWEIKPQDIIKILDGVFKNFDKERSLKNQILDGEYTAWESLRFAIDLIQQIRNSGPEDSEGKPTHDDDFILSPIRNQNGKHFDSREFLDKENKEEKAELPSSGDANGAYNIARKGIIMFEHIKRDLQLYITEEEYDNWLASKDLWEKYLKNNEENLKNKKKKKSEE